MKIGREASILLVNQNIMLKIISWSVKSGITVNLERHLDTFYVQFNLVLPLQMELKRSTAKTKLLTKDEVHFTDDYLHNNMKVAERKTGGENRVVIIKSIK